MKKSKAKAKDWIKGAIKKPGALRKTLGVKAGEKIPAAKLKKAATTGTALTKKRVALAKTLAKMRKK